MTVTTPPRPPRPGELVDREELEALVEALFEEARQRARRRRRIYTASVALVALVGVAVSAVLQRSTQPDTASPALAARSGLPAATTGSKIAFISIPCRFGTQGPGGLFVVNADGSGKRKLTRAKYATPTWSPDGRKFAFVSSGPRLRHEHRRKRRAEPHEQPSWGRCSCLVPRRAQDRLPARRQPCHRFGLGCLRHER